MSRKALCLSCDALCTDDICTVCLLEKKEVVLPNVSGSLNQMSIQNQSGVWSSHNPGLTNAITALETGTTRLAAHAASVDGWLSHLLSKRTTHDTNTDSEVEVKKSRRSI